MKVLVTGASGFVGRQVVDSLLKRNHEVVGTSRSKATSDITCEWITSDLLQPGEPHRVIQASKPDGILHAAWTIADRENHWTDPINEQWVEASLELAGSAVSCGVRRICAVGTCFEYDWPADLGCDEETTPLKDHIPYSAAKNRVRRKLTRLTDEAKVSFAWARLFHLYGPHERPSRLVGSVASALARGEIARCSKGEGFRDFMDVRDAGRALACVMTSSVCGPINVASGKSVRIAEVATMLGEIAGRPDLISLGSLPGRSSDPPRITANIGKLRENVGFSNSITLRQGLTDAMEYWRGKIQDSSRGLNAQ